MAWSKSCPLVFRGTIYRPEKSLACCSSSNWISSATWGRVMVGSILGAEFNPKNSSNETSKSQFSWLNPMLSILMGLVSDFTFFVGHIPCFSQIMSNHVIHSHQVMEKSISLYKISINIYSSYMFSHLIVPSIFPFIPLDLPVATTPRHSSRGPALHEFRGALRLLRHQTGPQLPTQLLTLLMGWRKRWGYI